MKKTELRRLLGTHVVLDSLLMGEDKHIVGFNVRTDNPSKLQPVVPKLQVVGFGVVGSEMVRGSQNALANQYPYLVKFRLKDGSAELGITKKVPAKVRGGVIDVFED